MPRAKDSLRVEVSEQTANDTRTILVTITVPTQEFLLADLLRQRGAVGALDMPLKQAARETIQGYLDSVEELIAGVAAGQKRATTSTKPKGKTAAAEAAISHHNGTKESANGSMGETHGTP